MTYNFELTTPDQFEGGVRNIVSFDSDGVMHTRDVQEGHQLDKLLDANSNARNHYDLDNPNGASQGRLVARVPIVMWHNWKREWEAKYRQYWTWSTFEIMKLNSREFSYLRTINGQIGVPENVRTRGA